MRKKVTLILDGQTIRKVVNISQAIPAVEKAFLCMGQGKTQMPSKLYIHLDKYHGDFRAMPAYIEGLESCVVKWVNVHPQNKNLPTVMAVIILSDPKTGFPLCIMDATYLTALRTAAAGAVAAKYLARKNSKIAGFIGAGVQARTQFQALNELFGLKKVFVWDFKRIAAIHFIKDMRRLNREVSFELKNSVKETVADADIIITTTPSRKPLVNLEWLKCGVHINAIGADAKGKQELDPRILKKAKIVVDLWEQAWHSGEINVPLRKKLITHKNICADIGEIVSGKKIGRCNNKEITVFDSTGLAIQDAAIASLIYKIALKNKNGIGIHLIR